MGGAGGNAVSERSFETEETTTGAVEGVEGGTAGAIGSLQTDTKSSQEILANFVEEWLQVLGKEEMKSVAMFLCYHLVSMFSFTETKAAEYAALMTKAIERFGGGEVGLLKMMESCPNQSTENTNALV